MAPVTTSIDAATGGVKIQWVAPADGSDAITGFLIEVADANGATYVVLSESTTDCVKGPGALSAATYCVLPMSVLAAATAPLAFGTLVRVQARASNSYGLSDISIANSDAGGARIRRVPDQMPVPTVVSVTEAKIVLSWQPLTTPANGDSAVTAYNVLWDNGSGTAALVLHDGVATTVEAPGLTPGVNYRFKLRARNVYGSGAFSAVPAVTDGLLVVLASDRPDKVSIPTVTIGATETAVTISWQKPGHHAADIDAYEILFLTAAGGFTTEPTSCDGVSGAAPSVTAASIVAVRLCVIPMAALRTVTGLAVDVRIRAKVRAHNVNGWGDASELSSNTAGAKIETLPLVMAAPTFDAGSSSTASIVMSWTAVTGAAAGGAAVTISNYVVRWDAGAPSNAWAEH